MSNMRKIFATVGPPSLNGKIIKEMDVSGVDMFRVNITHTTPEMLKLYLKILKDNTEKPICIDSDGSGFRVRDRNGDFTERDKECHKIAQEENITHFALSFTDTGKDVWEYRKLLYFEDELISKIETRKGVENAGEIIDVSEAVLIDRGDLSKEIGLIDIPRIQQKLINLAAMKRKEVYTATNFCESMMFSNRPSIAEVSDVVHNLRMGVSGLVLAAETAIGKFPVETVKFVKEIIEEYE